MTTRLLRTVPPAKVAYCLIALLIGSVCAFAQDVYDGNQNLPPFGSFHGSEFDIVALQNGNLHIKIPIANLPQRGGSPYSVWYKYDTTTFERVWVPQPTPTNPDKGTYRVGGASSSDGWELGNSATWILNSPSESVSCPGVTTPITTRQHFVVTDPEGAKHPVTLRIGTGSVVC